MTHPPLQDPPKAALWMIGAILSFSAMAIGGRQVSHLHDTFEIMTARSAIGFGIVLAGAAFTGQLREISAQRLGGHALRNIVHFTGQNLWFWALTLIPLAQLFALEFTSPLWVILLAPLLLGERFTRTRIIAAALGFAGILIVTRPFGAPLGPGVIAAAAAAIFFAMTSILTKRLTRRETMVSILFWLTGMQFVFGALGTFWDGLVHWPDSVTGPWLFLIGGAGVLAHLSLTSALRLAPASFVMPIDFVRLPMIAVIAAWFYDEAIDPWVLLGGVVIFFAAWLNVRSELRHKPDTLVPPASE